MSKYFVVEDDTGDYHVVALTDLEMDMIPLIRFQHDGSNAFEVCTHWAKVNAKREPGQSYLLD